MGEGVGGVGRWVGEWGRGWGLGVGEIACHTAGCRAAKRLNEIAKSGRTQDEIWQFCLAYASSLNARPGRALAGRENLQQRAIYTTPSEQQQKASQHFLRPGHGCYRVAEAVARSHRAVAVSCRHSREQHVVFVLHGYRMIRITVKARDHSQ